MKWFPLCDRLCSGTGSSTWHHMALDDIIVSGGGRRKQQQQHKYILEPFTWQLINHVYWLLIGVPWWASTPNVRVPLRNDWTPLSLSPPTPPLFFLLSCYLSPSLLPFLPPCLPLCFLDSLALFTWSHLIICSLGSLVLPSPLPPLCQFPYLPLISSSLPPGQRPRGGECSPACPEGPE